MTPEVTPIRIHLSTPHMSGDEMALLQEAFESNWIAPLGPQVDAFEREFAARVGAEDAAALSSGTAALHLSLILAGVGRGDRVLVPTLTFAASAFPVSYLGAEPVFVDCETTSWNIDAGLVAAELDRAAATGSLPAAVIAVHLLGQAADLDPIIAACARHGVPLVEDAAEALGSTYRGRAPGTFGDSGIFSFNGNKIITTSGGGMLVSDDRELVRHARKLAAQARDEGAHYQHSEIGFNYRMSNLLAALGRGQLHVLDDRVEARRRNFRHYKSALGDLPGIALQPEAPWGTHTRWLSCILIDPIEFGADRETVRLELNRAGIDSRPIWKPMHLQPVFHGKEVVGGPVAEDLFDQALCLPSGSSLTIEELSEVSDRICDLHRRLGASGS